MNSDVGFAATLGAVIILLFGMMMGVVTYADGQEQESMKICVSAGNEWVESSCIKK